MSMKVTNAKRVISHITKTEKSGALKNFVENSNKGETNQFAMKFQLYDVLKRLKNKSNSDRNSGVGVREGSNLFLWPSLTFRKKGGI
jgi:hypothetical protein